MLATSESVANINPRFRRSDISMPNDSTPVSENVPSHLTCTKCETSKPIDQFSHASKHHRRFYRAYWCKACHLESARDHNRAFPEKLRANAKRKYWKDHAKSRKNANDFYHRHREVLLQRLAERRQLDKIAAFEAYGGPFCKCCNEATQIFLSIDHIDNNGGEHRKGDGKNLYRWLRAHKYPPGFQVLCFNCNRGKYLNGGICPHQVEPDATPAK